MPSRFDSAAISSRNFDGNRISFALSWQAFFLFIDASLQFPECLPRRHRYLGGLDSRTGIYTIDLVLPAIALVGWTYFLRNRPGEAA